MDLSNKPHKEGDLRILWTTTLWCTRWCLEDLCRTSTDQKTPCTATTCSIVYDIITRIQWISRLWHGLPGRARFITVNPNELNWFSCFGCDFISTTAYYRWVFTPQSDCYVVCIIYSVSPKANVTPAPNINDKRKPYANMMKTFVALVILVQPRPTKVPAVCKMFSLNCHLLLQF